MDRKVSRLRKVVALAELEEQNESIEMKKAQRALDQAIDRLDELTSYRRKYQSDPKFKGTVGAVRWQDYQRFLTRLNQAVESQHEFVNGRRQALEAHRLRWQEKHKRVSLLEKIMQRYLRAEAARDEKLMQKALDDLQPVARLFD